MRVLDTTKCNPHILNPNGSNSMHILFANFENDPNLAAQLGTKLIQHGINLNLIDNNGLSPLHVAIKKNQVVAL